jgi:hypothetical protein
LKAAGVDHVAAEGNVSLSEATDTLQSGRR